MVQQSLRDGALIMNKDVITQLAIEQIDKEAAIQKLKVVAGMQDALAKVPADIPGGLSIRLQIIDATEKCLNDMDKIAIATKAKALELQNDLA